MGWCCHSTEDSWLFGKDGSPEQGEAVWAQRGLSVVLPLSRKTTKHTWCAGGRAQGWHGRADSAPGSRLWSACGLGTSGGAAAGAQLSGAHGPRGTGGGWTGPSQASRFGWGHEERATWCELLRGFTAQSSPHSPQGGAGSSRVQGRSPEPSKRGPAQEAAPPPGPGLAGAQVPSSPACPPGAGTQVWSTGDICTIPQACPSFTRGSSTCCVPRPAAPGHS